MAAFLSESQVLHHVAYHVFLPPKLPQRASSDDHERQIALKLASSVIQAAHQYEQVAVELDDRRQWVDVIRMLQHIYNNIQIPLHKRHLFLTLKGMSINSVLALHIRAQNAAVIVRRQPDGIIFEVFEVQAANGSVMSTPGKLVRHYPGPAVTIPNTTAGDVKFLTEISNFLTQMDTEYLEEAVPTTRKAGSTVDEERESVDPSYFIQLFIGILRGMGDIVDPPRVVKRVADEVLWKDALKPWRRSPIWLIIRIALQTSLESTLSYKHFMAYYHAYVLSLCHKREDFSSDLLFSMRVKMARRLYKIKDSAPAPVATAVSSAAQATQVVLQKRWAEIQANQAASPEWDPSAFDVDAATNQSLINSRDYLEQVFKGRSGRKSHPTLNLKHQPRLENVTDFTRYANGNLAKAFSADEHVALFDFEASVFEHLKAWTNANRPNAINACKIISSCFEQYFSAASSCYTIDIADQSIMVLTLMRLWMAVDQLASFKCPLLLHFSPEIRENILDPLLLHTSLHLEQARTIQEHLRSRRAQALSSNRSIFSDEASLQSFGVQYFRQSSHLQSLKSTIESDAQKKRDLKVQELMIKNDEHPRLARQVAQSSHQHFPSQTKQDRRKNCKRCRNERTLNRMKIQVHEWPLPSRQLDAELLVFELQRPEVFTIWRDTTYAILHDLGSLKETGNCKPYTDIERYDGLRQWLGVSVGFFPRIIIASSTKPFTMVHYKTTKIPAEKERVCVNNGLQYKLYDKRNESWAIASFTDVTFERFGTLKLPPNSSYQHLQYALDSTAHSSNQVLADQSNCPKDLSLHEHLAYGALRSGPRLQWMNILRGLEENILAFTSEEVKLLHTQAAWQIGQLCDDGSREWHRELNNPDFGELLVLESGRLLKRIEGNWLETNALSIVVVVILVSRLLASSPDHYIAQSAYKFLREARRVSLKWLEQLQSKLQRAEIATDILDYQSRVCEMAAICRSTFDVDPHHITSLLSDPEDFAALVKCLIILYDNQPPDLANGTASLRTHLCRDRRLSHRTFGIIVDDLGLNHRLLCAPISEIWLHYRAGPNGWRELMAPNSRWAATTTAGGNAQVPQRVHLNLLNGQLLVDGKPLGRLPREYVQHPIYLRLFGQKILDVVPASSPGMVFATRNGIHGHEVSFLHLEASDEMIVQARKGDQIYELVPHSRLLNDFPEFLSSDYHHWADLQSRIIEFRPLDYPWTSFNREWVLRFNRDGAAIMGSNGNESSHLIDIHSSLFHLFSRRLGPLESPRHLHIIRSPENQIRVELPRMSLSFFVNREMQLESQNFRGQIVDANQSTGTMFGLRSQLVLRAKDPVNLSLPRSRFVLIPHGNIDFIKQGHHVSVTVQPGSDRHILFHRYLVDGDLGLLASDSGLTSRLFKIYLHALTSSCLPDPLTGRTGTEEALSALEEPASSSFEQLDVEQARLLRLIGSLTPKREYYPAHLKCMQLTHWVNLPPLSQHSAFCTVTSNILARARTLQLFHPLDFEIQEFALNFESTLLKRATRRLSVYYPITELDAVAQTESVHDRLCTGRDDMTVKWVDAGHTAAWISGLVFRTWGRSFNKPYNLVSLAESWEAVEVPPERLDLNYSSRWLDLSLPASWITIYDLCRQAGVISNKFALATCLASAGFSQRLPPDLLTVLVTFAVNPVFQSMDPPSYSSFDLKDGNQPTRDRVEKLVSSYVRKLEDSPANGLNRQPHESEHSFGRRQRTYYDQQIQKYKVELANSLIAQWPSSWPAINPSYSSWFTIENCRAETQRYFSSCLRNVRFRNHLRSIQEILGSQPASVGSGFHAVAISPIKLPACPKPQRVWTIPNLSSLLCSRPCPDVEHVPFRSGIPANTTPGLSPDTSRLSELFNEFRQDRHPLNRRYGDELDASRRDLTEKPPFALPHMLPSVHPLIKHGLDSRGQLEAAFRRLQSALSPLTSADSTLFDSGIWPRITPRELLKQLSLKSRLRVDTPLKWQSGLVGYAQMFMKYQQSQRLVALANSGSKEEFYQELDSSFDDFEEGSNDPDWLLVQIDGNFRMRSVQYQVAKEMIAPSTGKNTVLQLNMGEGKSSVIVPIIGAAMANTKQLVRVIVLKPLWRQMFHLLVNRLAGLAHRRIYYLPFGRHIKLDSAKSRQLRSLYLECMKEGGVLLAQPEHVLSFKLMGIDQLISSLTPEENSAAHQLQDTQHWLTEHARDILDESDEILHVRYQLVYTVGEQQPLEGYPDRWTITQQVLQLTAAHIAELEAEGSGGLKHEKKGDGQFSSIRILPDCDIRVEKRLARALGEDVLAGRIMNLNCSCLSPTARKIVVRFLTEKEVPYMNYQQLKRSCDSVMWRGLLLVRGLLASGILVFALRNKRYRVDYGLDLSRSLLAVPYRAKDIPSLRAEFGHPDITLVLTCLSYYYKGLTGEQLKSCFELLYRLDNPSLEYEQWVARNDDTHTELCQLSGVNIKNHEQFKDQVMPTFSRNSAVIDFFLSSVVFPKAAKTFPHKLSTSGWDLTEHKAHVTTGFSGTNDNRYLLPTSITQADPVKQLSTNALVLTYLLRPENNHYIRMCDENGQNLDAKSFLKLLVGQTPEIRVLLDVGAQMLELQNKELVQSWLKLRPDIEAAIYFNDEDELVVLTQDGTSMPLYLSPFAQQLDRCIVYLDDGHTRGTDLKLPRNTRALVTLGPKVTKDRLLQGCMRMRKLGHGQSVLFAAPPEIDRLIRAASPKPLNYEDKVGTLDVLRWTMLETCNDLKHHASHWTQQAIDYQRRVEAQRLYASNADTSKLKNGWAVRESRALEEMYGIQSPLELSRREDLTQQAFNDPTLRGRLSVLGVETLGDSGMDEEQEREVNHEIERELQVERPPKVSPARHEVHKGVHYFVRTGELPPPLTGLNNLFLPFGSFGIQAVTAWSPNLYATTDFLQTVEGSTPAHLSDYMRPVNWILEGPGDVRVVLSPYEVNELLPLIRKSEVVRLHVYAPRVTRSMRSFSELDFYSIPLQPTPPFSRTVSRLSSQLQLDIFAGQLYLSSYNDYRLLCSILGLYIPPTDQGEQPELQVETDGFVKPENRTELTQYYPAYGRCRFTSSPIPMLKELIGHRRKGMKYLRTHVGQILHARTLTLDDL